MIFTIPYWRNKKGRLVPSLIIGYVKWIYLKFLPIVAHYPLNIFSEISFYRLSLYISYLQMFSFGLNTHEISRF